MLRTLMALTITASLFAGGVSAFDPADLQKLKDENKCVECDLRGADLSGLDLTWANLSGSKLQKANFAGARMTSVDLSGANLTNAVLSYAYLNGAKLCNTTMPDGSVFFGGC